MAHMTVEGNLAFARGESDRIAEMLERVGSRTKRGVIPASRPEASGSVRRSRARS